MLLIDIHKLQVILAQSVAGAALEGKIKNIWSIVRLQSQNILILGCAQNFCKRGKVDTKGDVAIATVWRETFGLEHHGDEGNVGVVHSLERDTGVITVEVAVLYQILNGFNDLVGSVRKTRQMYYVACLAVQGNATSSS